ncbi:MAG TPA: hypothetical protein VIP11_09255 [Gemmatimonadaceae bacterium]
MSRNAGGIALLVVAALMFFGFMRSSASIAAPATIVALLLTTVAPAIGGVMLLRGGGLARSRRLDQLRQQTIDAEILRMAVSEGGRLTALEVATALALTPETAKEALDALVARDIADIAVSDRGVVVYTFHDAKHIGGKDQAKGVLDA